ncbi:hypothetical protein PybrP1_011072 [[Pythium] brassicae (nom. inval.)]|nr:hypothetical protein PybrP1_011072 [[Pythium] brassicae (nom. inval.)]
MEEVEATRESSTPTIISLVVHAPDAPAPQTLRFACDWDVGIGGSVWTSGQVLAGHLQQHADKYRPLFAGKCVLELGSGTGFVGLMTAVCFAPARVLLTDLATHVASLERNVALNAALLPPSTRVRVAELSWGSAEQEDALLASLGDGADTVDTVDVIIGTDVAYLHELYEPLLHSLRRLAGEQTLVLLGLNRADTDTAFFTRLEQDGFEYYKVPDEQLHRDYHGKDFGLFEIRRGGDGRTPRYFGGRGVAASAE